MTTPRSIPSVSVSYAQTEQSKTSNELGMRVMQERAYEKRGEQYLLIKSPPASGKSRALMFIALDKLHNQGLKKAIIVVPEKSIGASFNNEPLTEYGFYWDWTVAAHRNLCLSDGEEGKGKVQAVKSFLESDDQTLVCTHATFRFAVSEFGVEAFDQCLLAIDEFHHVSANPDNQLGEHLKNFIERDQVHIVAMTGSYFRGDGDAVLSPEDEDKFEKVTYTYYEQLNGYQYLKQLDIGYYFYTGRYLDQIDKVLDSKKKTIIHIPNVNSRESSKLGKDKEVETILDRLGKLQDQREEGTGFLLVETEDGRMLKIADLVDDSPNRAKLDKALADPDHKEDRDYVDIIIALGKAKEGFDWIWCEHALTIGYRASLTEIIQIIGRATRDAEGKTHARFTNLIAEPDASEDAVSEAINDTLKAIAASLLMEQVLTPKFEFTPKTASSEPLDGVDYGDDGYDPNKTNIGLDPKTGAVHVEIKGLINPKSKEAKRVCKEDLNEIVGSFIQNRTVLEQGLFNQENIIPEELTQVLLGKIIKEKYPHFTDHDQEAIRQRAIASLTLIQQGKKEENEETPTGGGDGGDPPDSNTGLIDGVRRFIKVKDLDIDLIDKINPFGEAYSILAKAMTEESLRQISNIIAAKKSKMSIDDAREYAKRAIKFKNERGRLPSINAQDPWERKLAEGIVTLQYYAGQSQNG